MKFVSQQSHNDVTGWNSMLCVKDKFNIQVNAVNVDTQKIIFSNKYNNRLG